MEENENLSTQVEESDNSSNEHDTQALIDEILNEPEESTEDQNKENATEVHNQTQEGTEKDNTAKYPEKFMKDGKLDVDKLNEAYKNLERLNSQQSAQYKQDLAEYQKLKEKIEETKKQADEEAKRLGYQDDLDRQNNLEIANFEANEYSRYLQYVDDEIRDDVRNLLVQYASNPSDKLMSEIEMEFAPEINKRIAIQAYKMREEHNSKLRQNAETQKMTNIESVISQSVDDDEELFGNEPFKNLFTQILQRYGDNFTIEDSKTLREAVKQIQKSTIEAYEKSNGIKKANSEATDKLASITGTNSAKGGSSKRLSEMSESEFDQFLDEII